MSSLAIAYDITVLLAIRAIFPLPKPRPIEVSRQKWRECSNARHFFTQVFLRCLFIFKKTSLLLPDRQNSPCFRCDNGMKQQLIIYGPLALPGHQPSSLSR